MPRLLVGESGWDGNGSYPDSGRVFVFRIDPQNGTVVHQTVLSDGESGIPPGTIQAGDRVGAGQTGSVGDIDGDGLNDALISLPVANDGGISSGGAILVLFLDVDDTVFHFERHSQASGSAFDSLSASVTRLGWGLEALSPRQEGHAVDVAAGAFGSDAVVVFAIDGNGTVVPGSIHEVKDNVVGIPPGTISASSQFGYGLANMGDVDGDSVEDLAVGARKDATSGTDSGVIFLFYLLPGNETDLIKGFTKLTLSTTGITGFISASTQLTLSGAFRDLDGDGRVDLVAGA